MCYRDKTFCNKGDKISEKCRQCDRYFDVEEYKQYSEQIGFEYPVAFFEKKPCACEKENEKGKQ